MNSHLLGKKSWNVYNPENIARVKRDEAQAKAREEEEERLMQDVDAEHRIKILRGEHSSTPQPPPPPPAASSTDAPKRPERESRNEFGFHRKKRRIAGEDDTDRDIRFAREDAQRASSKRDELSYPSKRSSKDHEAPILDNKGHINLFPQGSKTAEKNAEAEAETRKKERSYEDQYTMRFSNAGGFKEKAGRQPWYSSGAQLALAPDAMPGKNVWGDEDPMRREREKARVDTNDPLAAMKRGVRQLKVVQQERKSWNDEKRKEIESLKSTEAHRVRSHRRRRSNSTESLDTFRLDESLSRGKTEKLRTSSHQRHRHHRNQSLDRDRDHSRRRSHEYSDHSRHHRDNGRRSRRQPISRMSKPESVPERS